MYYFIGTICVLAGIGLILKTEWVVQNFGVNAWAEEHLGVNGGSRLLYKFIGLIVIFVGFLLITNLWESFLMATVAKIFIR